MLWEPARGYNRFQRETPTIPLVTLWNRNQRLPTACWALRLQKKNTLRKYNFYMLLLLRWIDNVDKEKWYKVPLTFCRVNPLWATIKPWRARILQKDASSWSHAHIQLLTQNDVKWNNCKSSSKNHSVLQSIARQSLRVCLTRTLDQMMVNLNSRHLGINVRRWFVWCSLVVRSTALTCRRHVTCSSSAFCFSIACSTSQPDDVEPVPNPVPLAQ